MTFYNENDPKAAAWLRELIRAGLIPAGDVDERSIVDVRPGELTGYCQQHFFAGIGGWAYALRLAGWPDDRPVRTGSCPCQPFSAAGKGLGEKDERHLWPVFRDLITFGEPTVTFGEQVASAAGRVWLARVRADLEGLGYGVGGADLCAASVGSPNIRQRLFWMARAAGSSRPKQQRESREGIRRPADSEDAAKRSGPRWMGDAPDARLYRGSHSGATCGATPTSDCKGNQPAGRIESSRASSTCWLENANNGRCAAWGGVESQGEKSEGGNREPQQRGRAGGLGNADEPRSQGRYERGNGADQWTPWSASVVLPCTDGKSRRIEPGSFPLAHGVSGRVGLLRGYGNAINPWLAAEFILACEEALDR